MSRVTCSAMPGRWILRMTAVPSVRHAAMACASEALASGSGPRLLKTSKGSRASSSASRAWICGHGAGGTWSCSLASSAVTGTGSRSVRVDRTCPSLTKIGQASSSASRSRRPSWAGSARPPLASPGSPYLAAIRVSWPYRRVLCAIRRSARHGWGRPPSTRSWRAGRASSSTSTIASIVVTIAATTPVPTTCGVMWPGWRRSARYANTTPAASPGRPASSAWRSGSRTPSSRPPAVASNSTSTITSIRPTMGLIPGGCCPGPWRACGRSAWSRLPRCSSSSPSEEEPATATT